MDPLPSINKVFPLIIQEEKKREICVSPISHDTSFALMAKSALPKPFSSNHHEFVVYITKTSPRPKFFKQNYKKAHPMCSHCGVAGHTVEKCYKVHGYPPGFEFTRNRPMSHSTNQVQMQGTDLSGHHSQGTNLSGHHSRGTNLSGHHSRGTNLRGHHSRGTKLSSHHSHAPQLSKISAQCLQLMNLLNQHQYPQSSTNSIVGHSGILNPKHSVFSAYVNIASHSNKKKTILGL